MITIESVVWLFLFLLGCGLVFGLLYYLVGYIESQFPDMPLLYKACRILLVVLAVLLLISVILDLMGHPVIVWRQGARP